MTTKSGVCFAGNSGGRGPSHQLNGPTGSVEQHFHALVTIYDKHHDCTLMSLETVLKDQQQSHGLGVGTWGEKENADTRPGEYLGPQEKRSWTDTGRITIDFSDCT